MPRKPKKNYRAGELRDEYLEKARLARETASTDPRLEKGYAKAARLYEDAANLVLERNKQRARACELTANLCERIADLTIIVEEISSKVHESVQRDH
jgi:hypothetical protein